MVNQEQLKQCLQDCGMETKDMIQFLRCDNSRIQLCLLYRHRKILMDHLHQAQHKVDIVDYMIHQIQIEKEDIQ